MARERRAWSKQYQSRAPKPPNREAIRHYKDHAKGLADNQFVDSPPPRITLAKKEQAELELWLPEGCDQRVLGPSGRDQLQESWIYSNSQKNCFVLVHVDRTTSIERRSTTYSSIDLLMMYWGGDAIRWVEKRNINPA